MRPLALVVVLVAGCAPEPATPRPVTATPAITRLPAPAEPPPPAPAVTDVPGHVATDRPTIEPIGVPACDAYIAMYTACEPALKLEIAGGHRRPARNEAAWLKYMHDEVKDPGLADACKHMLEALRPSCPPGEPVTRP